MGKRFTEMNSQHQDFIRKQHIFFVGSAPLRSDGHVNVSPKGHAVLRILSPTEVAYLDLTGSGNETSAHVMENGRITFMFCAFEGSPLILRLYGTGRIVLPDTDEWRAMIGQFDWIPGARQIVRATIHRVQTSCGYAVPFFDYVDERDTLERFALQTGEVELENYRREKNAVSIDGLATPIGLHAKPTEDPTVG